MTTSSMGTTDYIGWANNFQAQGGYQAEWSAPTKNKKGEWVQSVTGFKKQGQQDDFFTSYEKQLQDQQRIKGLQEKYGLISGSGANTRTGSGNSSATGNEYGGDWTDSNSMYSYDNMKSMAKDMAQQQLEHSEKMMGLSYGYRSKEKVQDSDIRMKETDQGSMLRMREGEQKFGFEKALQQLSQDHASNMQTKQFNQENTMFRMQDDSATNKINAARAAANKLYYGTGRRVR